MNDNNGILLESGTNELEVILFEIGEGTFGINVMKVREIIQPQEVTFVPRSHPHTKGIIRLRDEIIPVIDLAESIGVPPSTAPGKDKLIVAELNKLKVAFHVHSVSRIHRISWSQIEKPHQLSQGLEDLTTGVIKMDGNMVLMLDYEKIIYDIIPEAGSQLSDFSRVKKGAVSDKVILIAEDSGVLRRLIKDTLEKAGFTQLIFTENGKQALDYLTDSGEPSVDLIITDIEMPVMDGHHLTKRIKGNPVINKLPVIIFSSLITGDLRHRGEAVGADVQISKPEAETLAAEVRRLTEIH